VLRWLSSPKDLTQPAVIHPLELMKGSSFIMDSQRLPIPYAPAQPAEPAPEPTPSPQQAAPVKAPPQTVVIRGPEDLLPLQ
jgi:hypothetical protein